jgi:hypothetical protein
MTTWLRAGASIRRCGFSAPTLFVWPLSFVIARKCTIRRIVLASLNYS